MTAIQLIIAALIAGYSFEKIRTFDFTEDYKGRYLIFSMWLIAFVAACINIYLEW